jgi:hypothetical protein
MRLSDLCVNQPEATSILVLGLGILRPIHRQCSEDLFRCAIHWFGEGPLSADVCFARFAGLHVAEGGPLLLA